jgi:hypothetical protein
MEWVNPAALRPTPKAVVDNLGWWEHSLTQFLVAKLIPNPDPTKVGWYSNASKSYGISVLIGKKWAQFPFKEEAREDPRCNDIAWLKTVAVRLGLLMLGQLGTTPGKRFLVRTDNTTTYGALYQRKSRDHWVNEEWKITQRLLLEKEIDLHPIWIASGENKADGLSRGERRLHHWRNNLAIALPPDLAPFLHQQLA